MKNLVLSIAISSSSLVVGNAHAAILLTSAATGTEGVSADTTTVSIDVVGSASVPAPFDDFATSGSISQTIAFGSSFGLTLDAVAVVNTTVGPNLGSKTTDGLIDRDSSGRLGVRPGGNGLEAGEGFLLGIDATSLSSTLAWQVTGIRFAFVGGSEEYTIVNRNDTSQVLTGTSNSLIDISSLGLTVQGGTSDSELASIFGSGTDTGNFRVIQLELDVVPEPSSFALLGLGLGGICLRRRRKSS